MVDLVQLHELQADGPLEILGSGGEAEVLAIARRPGVVLKRYNHVSQPVPPDRHALEQLIELPATMSPSDRAFVVEHTRWPTAVVLDGGQLHGLLMPRVGPEFYRHHGLASSPQTVLCDWNYLSRRRQFEANRNLYTDVPRLTMAQTLALVRDLATTMTTLHRHGLVIGDVSARNILWTDRPSPRVVLIDCDGIRPIGGRGVVVPKQTPEWDDPTLTSHETSQASDVYKLALAAYRGVWLASSDRPPAGLGSTPLQDCIPLELAQLIASSVAPAGRPPAQDWVDQLSAVIRYYGRPVVQMQLTPSPPTPRPKAPATRPVLPMPSPHPLGRPQVSTLWLA